MGSRVGSLWCPDKCQNHKTACLPEGRSSHKHLGERRFHAAQSKPAERKNTVLNWDLPAAISISTALTPPPVSIKSNKGNVQQSCWTNSSKCCSRRKALSLRTGLLAVVPSGCLPNLSCHGDGKAATSLGPDPSTLLKLHVSSDFTPRELVRHLLHTVPKPQDSKVSDHPTQDWLNEGRVYTVVLKTCDKKYSWVADVLVGLPVGCRALAVGWFSPGLPWRSTNCPKEFQFP